MNSLPIIPSSFTLPQLLPSHLHDLLHPSHKPIFHSLTSTISASKRRPSPFPLSSSFPLPRNSPPHLHILFYPILLSSHHLLPFLNLNFLLPIYTSSLTPLILCSSSTLPQPPPHVHILINPPHNPFPFIDNINKEIKQLFKTTNKQLVNLFGTCHLRYKTLQEGSTISRETLSCMVSPLDSSLLYFYRFRCVFV